MGVGVAEVWGCECARIVSPPLPSPQAKEAELRSAHDAARSVAAAVANVTGSSPGGEEEGGKVPEWKLREFEELRNAVATMWEQLDVPAEDVTAFLSEADLLAPYHPKVLDMYTDMCVLGALPLRSATAPGLFSHPHPHPFPHRYRRLTSAVAGPSSPGGGGGVRLEAPPSGYGARSPAPAPAPQSNTLYDVSPRRATPRAANNYPGSADADPEMAAYLARAASRGVGPALGGPGSRNVRR